MFGRKRNLLPIVQELSLQRRKKVSLKFLNDSLDVHDSAEGWCEMGHVLSCCHVLLGEHQGRGAEGNGGRRPGPQSVFWGEDGIVFTSHQLNSPLPLPQAEGGAHTHLDPTTPLLPARDFIPSSEFASHCFLLFRQV